MPIYVNNQLIECFKFSGGECQVRLQMEINHDVDCKAIIKNSDDILSLLLTIDAIRRINPLANISLTIPYVPYARQDRVCYEGEALSIVVMANLINSLKADSVTIWDPHSDVTPALINNVQIKTISNLIKNTLLEQRIRQEKLILVSPDAGAEKKVLTLAKSLTNPDNITVLTATKVRDPKTGTIFETRIQGVASGKSYLIVDDICDGGRTFIELAKVMKSQGAEKIYLYITHGIFSKGLELLFEYFETIYCVNSWVTPEHNDRLIILGE